MTWWQEVTVNGVGHYRPSSMEAFSSSSASTPFLVQSQGYSWSVYVYVKMTNLCIFKIPKRTILIQKQYSLCLIHVLHKCIARMWYYIVCVQKATVFIFEFKLGRSSQNLLSVAMDYINVAVNCIGILVPPDIELLSVPYPVEAAWVRFEWARTLTQATAASLGTWTWLLWASFWPAS